MQNKIKSAMAESEKEFERLSDEMKSTASDTLLMTGDGFESEPDTILTYPESRTELEPDKVKVFIQAQNTALLQAVVEEMKSKIYVSDSDFDDGWNESIDKTIELLEAAITPDSK